MSVGTASDVIPMPTARRAPGRYEVIGTSRAVECVRRERAWFLVVDGTEDVGPFDTKRQALQHAQESPEL